MKKSPVKDDIVNIDYGSIINRSIELIKKNKWLWVYGLTLAFLSGGSGGGGGGGGSRSGTSGKISPENILEDLPEKANKILGETTTLVNEWVASVPLGTWIVVGLGIFVVVLLWIIVSWIIQSWAKGGLIAGLEDADSDMPVTLLSTSTRGIQSVKHLILFGLISLGLSISVILAGIVFVGGGYLLFSFVPPVNFIWLILSLIVAVLALIVIFLLFTMLAIYAERLIVLKGYSPWNAWKKGFSLSKRNFISTVVMGIINTGIGCVGGCMAMLALILALGIPTYILLLPVFFNKGEFTFPGVPTLGALGVLLFLFITLMNLVKAAFILFNFSNWNLLFKEIWAKEDAGRYPPKGNEL